MVSIGATPSSPYLIFKFALEPNFSIMLWPHEILPRQLKGRFSRLQRGKTRGILFRVSDPSQLSTGNREDDDSTVQPTELLRISVILLTNSEVSSTASYVTLP